MSDTTHIGSRVTLACERIERVARVCRIGEEPSLVDEYAHFSADERLELFLRLRQRSIEDCHGTDPGFQRLHSIARRA
ncbi:MAG: hypothetical protein JSS45_06135 [Proteobacteria bacterium]|nr:hypothetical protein [Pseudomonadota bacterium]